MRTYKQLTYEQRCQIAVLNGTDMTQREIADAVGTSQATISRELMRNRVGIEERPNIVDAKSRTGDWEINTVIGKGHNGALVTIVERATQFTLVANVPNKSAEGRGSHD